MASITYEVSKFNPKPNAELLCAICFCVLHEARMCPCHHIFCNACIRRWLENSFTCPSCRNPVSMRQLELAPPLVLNVLSSLTMDCDNKEKGCDQSIAKENFPSHIANCDYRPVSCPHKDCSTETIARDLPAHKEECEYRSVECPKQCRLLLPVYKLEAHDCLTAMQSRVQELDRVLYRHQMVMSWFRAKLNNVQLPEQSPGVQLQAFREMLAEINHYWPADQPIPLRLCGSYVAPTASVKSQAGSSSSVDHRNKNESQSSNSTLEQLVAEASNDPSRPRVFGPRDPGGADGPTAHVVRDTPVRGVVYEEDIEMVEGGSFRNAYFSSDESETWDSPADPPYAGYFNSAEGDAGDSPYYEDGLASHRYQSPDTSVSRGGRRNERTAQEQDRYYTDEIGHSPEQSRSGFDEDQSYQTLDSSGHYSSFSDRENYSSASRSSATLSHQYRPSSSYINIEYSGHHSAYPDYNYSDSRPVYVSRRAESRYYSRSRSRSSSPQDVQSPQRYSRSRSNTPTRQYNPSRSRSNSYSLERSHNSSRSQSTENSDRSYSASPSRFPSRSQSRSCSISRGSSPRSPDQHQGESRSRTCSSRQSYSSSNQTQEEQFSDTNYWTRTDDDANNESAEDHGDWTPSWDGGDRGTNHDQWSGSEDLGEVLDEYESFSPVPSPTHAGEQTRQADSTNSHHLYDNVQSLEQGTFPPEHVERVQSRGSALFSTSEQVDTNHHDSPEFRVSPKGLQERRLNADVSDDEVHEQNRLLNTPSEEIVSNHPHIEQENEIDHAHYPETHVGQASNVKDGLKQNITAFENPAPSSRILELSPGDSIADAGRPEAVPCPPPHCSYSKDDAEKKLEPDNTGLSSDEKVFCPDTSRNVWESSSDTTSLDYEIPTEETTPKPDSGTERNSPSIGREHTEDSSVLPGNVSNQGRMCGSNGAHENGNSKSNSNQSDNMREKSSYSNSDESISNQQKKQQGMKSPPGKGKALKVKRKSKTPAVLSDSDSDETGDSDSNVCFKRRVKVKSLDSSSTSEGSSKESESKINQNKGDGASKASRQSNLPSTSYSSAKSADTKQGKSRRKENKGSEKKKLKYLSLKTKVKHEPKTTGKKRKPQKSKSHSSHKKARHDSSLSHKESGAALPSNVNKYDGEHLTVHTTNPSGHFAHALAMGNGNDGTDWTGWPAENSRKATRSHTFSRQDLAERTDNLMENVGMNIGSSSSRGRRLYQRPVETEGRTGSERRVVESDPMRRVEDSSGPLGMSVCHQERESGQVHTGGRRIMRIENSYGRLETRRHAAEEDNARTVVIADLPVPPSTLELLNQYDNSDDSGSTWSPSSSRTESSSTV